MGCWNGTCGISQLPILSGDDVWAFLIGVKWHRYADSGDQSGYCYPTDVGFPMSLPIYAKYNDYGGIEKIIENYNTKLILDAYSNSDGDIETFINDCIERDELFLFDRDIDKYGVGLFMIHAGVMNEIKLTRDTYFKDSFYNVVKKDGEYFFLEAKKFLASKRLTKKDFNLDSKEIFALIESLSTKSYFCENRFGRVFAGIGCNYFVDSWEPYRELLYELINSDKDASDETVKNLIEDTANWAATNHAIHSLRKSWIPQSGKGSQSREFEYYRKLNKATNKYIKKALRNESISWRKATFD